MRIALGYYFTQLFRGKYVDRFGNTLPAPAISRTIGDSEIAGTLSVLVDTIIDFSVRSPVWTDASRPVFDAKFETDDKRWFREHLTITSLGRSVLAGDVDWLSLSPPGRWLGGVCIRADVPCWRWDAKSGTPVLAQ
jgi:hypothetical protein